MRAAPGCSTGASTGKPCIRTNAPPASAAETDGPCKSTVPALQRDAARPKDSGRDPTRRQQQARDPCPGNVPGAARRPPSIRPSAPPARPPSSSSVPRPAPPNSAGRWTASSSRASRIPRAPTPACARCRPPRRPRPPTCGPCSWASAWSPPTTTGPPRRRRPPRPCATWRPRPARSPRPTRTWSAPTSSSRACRRRTATSRRAPPWRATRRTANPGIRRWPRSATATTGSTR